MLDTTWPVEWGGSTNSDPRRILALLLLGHRTRAWQQDLAVRLAEWLPTNRGQAPWLITYGLAAWSETVLPATDGFIRGWVSQGSGIRYQHQEIYEWFAARGWREPVPHHTTLLSWLRAEPRLAEFVPRLFEVDGVGGEFVDPYAARFGADNEWPKALTALAEEGALDRGVLLDQCLARLLRGDRPGNLRGFVALHEQLAPTPEETAERAGTYIRLAADAAGTVSKIALKLLSTLDSQRPLNPDAFHDLCSAVLTRPETTLARGQLAWMDKAVRRDPVRAGALVDALALAFGHPATAVQERAVGLAARWMPHLDPQAQARLKDAIGAVDASLQSEASRLLGAADPQPEIRSLMLPVPPVRTIPEAIESPAELAERFAAVLVSRRCDPMELERVLEGAVTQYHADCGAVAEAFAPLAARYPAQQEAGRWSVSTMELALGCLLDVLAGRSSHVAVQVRALLLEERLTSVDHIPLRRIYEIAKRLPGEAVPCLLATPTLASGSIEPVVLAGRLDRFQADSVTPWPDDLEQALLRLPEDARSDIAGQVRLLAVGGSDVVVLPVFSGFHTQAFGIDEFPDADGYQRISTPRVVPVMKTVGRPEECTLARILAQIPDPLEPQAYFWPNWNGRSNTLIGLWAGLAPHHGDLIAAHALPTFFKQADDDTSDTGITVLPLLAESGGSGAPVLHLALAYGLTAAGPRSRTAAVDALLTLAALDTLDPALLGGLLAALWHEHIARPNRFLKALGEAARAGAAAQVWTVVRTLITSVAAQPGLKGLPDLLSLGSECAALGNVRTEFPELGELALQVKPARLAKEAERLQEILRQ
ncbi:DUF6493 family protein [Streptomyces sp. SP17BM10]|uniref:DUF6493 family protein n=1 Tax=Streptomyces sp. SP17BM10 TaxID=3002530 RepID=UPI002E788A3B|nr:DUF6493 family protein [Streptomyces sp. SP17BM10]MEE1783264.1 DUF6493 family protein [Streptomyces sp. SP17BM10]